MSLMDRIKAQAKADKKRIVLPEGAEERTVKAAAILLKEGICDVILLGDEEKIAAYGEDLTGATIINRPVEIAGGTYNITCASVGNPHCVVFCEDPSVLDLETLGPQFEHAKYFPDRINTEFVRIVNENTLRMRVYERGNGETVACGTGACAAVIAATENGFVEKGKDITVKLIGGDLVVNYTDHEVILTGDAVLVYEGVVEY